METVGFIGIGNMGSGMSNNIQSAGYPMVVYDVREAATKPLLDGGARLAGSPAEVARLSDVTFTSLPGPKEVEEVGVGPEGILEGIKADGIYVDLSTSRPTLIQQMAPRFLEIGAHVLDAPVSGGKSGAATGNLAVYVGGDREVYQRVKPILDAFGNNVLYCGELGSGSVCKLVHNMISASVRQAIAEGLTLGVKAGVEPRVLWEGVRRGDLGRMSILHELLPRTVLRSHFDPPLFALSLLRKDVGLATELGTEYDVPLPIANLTEQTIVQAMNRGWQDRDSIITFLLQEEAAGVEVRAPEVDPEMAAKFLTTHPDVY